MQLSGIACDAAELPRNINVLPGSVLATRNAFIANDAGRFGPCFALPSVPSPPLAFPPLLSPPYYIILMCGAIASDVHPPRTHDTALRCNSVPYPIPLPSTLEPSAAAQCLARRSDPPISILHSITITYSIVPGSILCTPRTTRAF